jgi:tripartite-type tricarboxylate transporter receptor subunit TctC
MKRVLWAMAALCAGLGLAQAQSPADSWPNKQVRFIVPFGAGGTTDLFARMIGEHLQSKYGQPFIVENRAGAAGNTGVDALAKAAGDGYTIGMGTVSTHAINPALYKEKIPFNNIKDFQPVSLVALVPNILVVHPDRIKAKTVAELIEHIKANPGKVTFASSGTGTSIHLAGELLQQLTGTKMVHVPYRSSGAIMNDLIGGQVDMAFDNAPLAWPQVQGGKLRALAVTTMERQPFAPDLPTMNEQVKGFEATSWHGVFAPASTPPAIVDKLSKEIQAFLRLPATEAKLKELGVVRVGSTPEEFMKHIVAETAKWGPVVEKSGAKVE